MTDQTDHVDWRALVAPVVSELYELRDSDGVAVTTAFQTLPDRKLTAYYKTIKRPTSLFIIKQKLNQGKYAKISEFIRDVAQIVYNAKLFNEEDSDIYRNANILQEYLEHQIEKFQESGQVSMEELAYPDIEQLLIEEEKTSHDAAKEQEKLNKENDADARANVTEEMNDYEDAEEEPDNEVDDGEEDDEDDEDAEVEEDIDENDNDSEEAKPAKPRKRGRPRGSSFASGLKRLKSEDSGDGSADGGVVKRKRGRPPLIEKPHEQRIKAILRTVKRARDSRNRNLSAAFDRLPNSKEYPDYYQQIEKPISLEHVHKKIKDREYPDVDAFVADMNLMFENAKKYNADESQIYQDAVSLQKLLDLSVKEELIKPDSAFQTAAVSGRKPLDQVVLKGETYRVGDWVHIKNPNESCKPIIGQIYKMWQTSDGRRWFNACWYYRPEQTVHRVDKLFFENEVIRSSQYRDHAVEDLLGKCFVMFITKYQKGRPSGIGDRIVYCCESRYNETDKTFTKIRTWKVCLPEDSKGGNGEYPMEYFEKMHPIIKVPSPIRHLIPPNAKLTDPVPDPKMGQPNAPPIVGAVYKRPYDPNDPPEQPTMIHAGYATSPNAAGGPLPQAPSGPVNVPTTQKITSTQLGLRGGVPSPGQAQHHMNRSGTVGSPQISGSASPSLGAPTIAGSTGGGVATVGNVGVVGTPAAASSGAGFSRGGSPAVPAPVGRAAGAGLTPSYGAPVNSMNNAPINNRIPLATRVAELIQQHNRPVGVPPLRSHMTPGPPTVFSLPEHVQQLLPNSELEHIARTRGQMVWFSAPPLWVPERRTMEPVGAGLRFSIGSDGQDKNATATRGLGHSTRYMAWKIAQSFH